MRHKFFLFLSIFVFMGISICFAQEKYVRKQLKPNFYVPENAIKKQEKLPPIYVPKPTVIKVKRNPVEEIEEYDMEETDEYDIAEEGRYEDGDVSISKIASDDKYIEFVAAGYTETPLYGRKFEQYSKDLIYISETGKYPENKELDKDLSAMNTNDKSIF